ncbi:hypothetical protein CMI37_31640 [Candidatus Pacearchaeota archaeon]|nr:hypothetical protein [Candidatus Pacearchaeota archaeon]
MAEALSVVNTTARKYFAGAADLTVRRRLFLRLLSEAGRVVFNEEGESCYWNVEFDQPPVQSHGASGEYSFDEHDLYRQLNIDVRGYVVTDKMDYKNSLMNKGSTAIINRYKRIMPNLKKSLDSHFHSELYIDGYAAANGNRLHGLESFLGQGTTVAADIVAQPSDTYGGKSTALGNEGGSWSTDLTTSPNAAVATDWPDGNGDSSYDYLSPVIVNATSTNWGPTTAWEDNCGKILRRTTTWLTKNGGEDGIPSCYMMGNNKFNGLQDYHETKFRVITPHPQARDLGFQGSINQDGVICKYEFDVPATKAYGINVNQMELASWDEVLFATRGPFYDIKSDAYLFKAGFFGNARYQPKHFALIEDIA